MSSLNGEWDCPLRCSKCSWVLWILTAGSHREKSFATEWASEGTSYLLMTQMIIYGHFFFGSFDKLASQTLLYQIMCCKCGAKLYVAVWTYFVLLCIFSIHFSFPSSFEMIDSHFTLFWTQNFLCSLFLSNKLVLITWVTFLPQKSLSLFNNLTVLKFVF